MIFRNFIKYSHCHVAFICAILTINYYLANNYLINWSLVFFNYNATFILYHLDNILDSIKNFSLNHPKRFLWQKNKLKFIIIHLLFSFFYCLIISINLKLKTLIFLCFLGIMYIIYRYFTKFNSKIFFGLKGFIVLLTWLSITNILPYVEMNKENLHLMNLIGTFSLLFLNYFFCNAQDFKYDQYIKRTNILEIISSKKLLILAYFFMINLIIIFLIFNKKDAHSLWVNCNYALTMILIIYYGNKAIKTKNNNSFKIDFLLILPTINILLTKI